MTFNTDHPHAEAFNNTVAQFLQEAESCMALVHGHKEVAHYNIVMASLVFVCGFRWVFFLCGLGFAVLLGGDSELAWGVGMGLERGTWRRRPQGSSSGLGHFVC